MTSPMMKKPTITDIAVQAGVSKSTVSHVLNNTRFVSEETRQKVLQVIQQAGYQPSLTARSLTTNRTETIGVIISDISSNFYIEVLRGIEDVIRPARYSLIVCNTDEIYKDEDHYLNLLVRQRVDGIIAAAAHQKWEVFDLAARMQIPIVFVDRKFQGMSGPFIGADNAAAARDAAHLIVEKGHRRIGVLSGPLTLSTMSERLAGFQQYLTSRGIALSPEYVFTASTQVEAGKLAAIKLLNLSQRPSALFASSYPHTLSALLAIKELHLRCPQDIALVGYDDHPWAAVSNPPLTIIRQPANEMGRKAAETLMSLVQGNRMEEPLPLLPCQLIIRESV
jgi:DNA-binding LacI/PurR family transcriptional regulator